MAAVVDSLRAFFAPTTFVIDSENPGDVVARENLLDRAMGAGRRRKSSEKLRRGRVPAEGLALVARDADGHVIGTVRLWNVEAGVNREGQPVPALLLGPLAVDPAHEGKGIGGMLMRAAVRKPEPRPWRRPARRRRRLLRTFRLLLAARAASRHARSFRAQSLPGARAQGRLARRCCRDAGRQRPETRFAAASPRRLNFFRLSPCGGGLSAALLPSFAAGALFTHFSEVL